MKKVISIIVLLALVVSLIACSCTGGGTEETSKVETTTNTGTQDPNTVPSIGISDLDGFVLKIAAIAQTDVAWSNTTIDVREDSADIIDSAIFKRDSKIKVLYNCDIQVTDYKKGDLGAQIEKDVKSDLPEYDLYFERAREVYSVANKGYLLDIESSLPNVDLSKVWWDQDFLEDTSIDGKNYMLVGDIVLTTADCLYSIIYHRTVASELGITDLHQLVYDGKWTLEKMEQYAQSATADNGDGVWDHNDRYGFIAQRATDSIYSLILGGDLHIFTKDQDDLPVFAANNEKFVTYFEKISNLIINLPYSLNDYSGSNREAITNMFSANNILFLPQVISAGAQYLREAKVDYGYLPMPKADENQTEYISHVNMGAPVFLVSKSSQNLEKTSTVLEALCYESYLTVMPEFYDTCFSVKYVPDEDSANMIKIALENRVYDLVFIWKWGDFAASSTDLVLQSKSNTIVSHIKSVEDKINEEINATLAKIVE